MLIPLLMALPLFGQDAGMVLSTSVTYRTQRASLKLTDEQAKTADLMTQEAQKETQAGHYDEAMRRYEHGFAAMHDVAWTPAVELVSSFQAKLDWAAMGRGASRSRIRKFSSSLVSCRMPSCPTGDTLCR